MKKIMGLVLGFMSIALVVGCQKKEAQAPIDQPMVVEQVVPAQEALPAGPATAMAPITAAVDAAATTMTETVMPVIEKPTAQQIQEALKNAGLYDGKIDGDIGPRTKKAIEEFQS